MSAPLRAHIAVLRDLAKRDPATTMLQLAMIGAMDEMATELERLSNAIDHPPDDPPERGLGTI